MKKNLLHSSIELIGLDAQNPLAFLAAIGTLRALTLMYPMLDFQMAWKVNAGSWRPTLSSSTNSFDAEALCDSLADWLATPPQLKLLETIGDNLTLSPSEFGDLARVTLTNACLSDPPDLASLDFLAAFGSDGTWQAHSKDRSLMQDTALRTMSGAGHQHFIKFMREIIASTSSAHLYSSLFVNWTYEDEGRGMNLRWDPIDDRRYAMRWKNPSSDPAVTMRGANRLAIEALPLFTTATIRSDLRTTSFRTVPRRGTFWFWPIWEQPINLFAIRSLIQHPGLTVEKPLAALSKLGVSAVFQSQRITVGKFRNFTPAVPTN
jgi:hypothetical protein